MHSRGFRTSDPHRNVMSQSTEMSPLVSMFFRTFLNPVKLFNTLVLIHHTIYAYIMLRAYSMIHAYSMAYACDAQGGLSVLKCASLSLTHDNVDKMKGQECDI